MTPTDTTSRHRLRQAFCGRASELHRIATTMAQTWSAGIALTGDDGVGKSRLQAEAAGAADPAAYRVIRAVTTPATAAVPFGALAEHLPPHLLSLPFGADAPRTAAEALRRPARGRRLVLAVDDAALLDEASAALASQMARRGELFVLTTVDGGRRLPHPIGELWNVGLADWIEIGPLSRDAVEEILAETLRGPLDGLLVQRCWEATAGNALLLRELITAQIEAGRLGLHDGTWRLTGPFATPPWLLALVDERMAVLPADCQPALELLAHTGPMRPEVLGALVPAHALEAAEAHRLIRVERHGGRDLVRLAYPLYGEVLRATTPRLRAQRWRTACANLLEEASDDPAELYRAATWRLANNQPPFAAGTVSAARGAYAALDLPLAGLLARRAAAAGDGLAVAEPLGYGLLFTGDAAEAETLLAALPRPDTDTDHARLAAVRAFTLFFGLDRDTQADALLHATAAELADPPSRDRLLGRRALLRACAGDHGTALRLAAGAPGEPEARLAYGLAQVFSGRPREGVHTLRDGWPDGAPWLTVLADLGTVHGLLWTGRIAEADRRARAAYDRALDGRWAFAMATACLLRALVARAQGRIREELHRCREGVAIARAHGPGGLLGALLGLLAHAQALTGETHRATATLAEADRLAGPSMRLLRPWTELGRVWVTAAPGRDPRLAREVGLEAAREAGLEAGFEAMRLHDLVRLGTAARAADRLRALAADADSPLVALYAAHARAVADGDARALAAVSAGFEKMESPLLAAEAAAEEAARHRIAFRPALASAASARALMLARRCGGTAPGTALSTLEAPQITPRENEVASLAARGLSSKEIGSRLVVSVRTVENHLQRVYRKFGISTRAELSRLQVLLSEAPTA